MGHSKNKFMHTALHCTALHCTALHCKYQTDPILIYLHPAVAKECLKNSAVQWSLFQLSKIFQFNKIVLFLFGKLSNSQLPVSISIHLLSSALHDLLQYTVDGRNLAKELMMNWNQEGALYY